MLIALGLLDIMVLLRTASSTTSTVAFAVALLLACRQVLSLLGCLVHFIVLISMLCFQFPQFLFCSHATLHICQRPQNDSIGNDLQAFIVSPYKCSVLAIQVELIVHARRFMNLEIPGIVLHLQRVGEPPDSQQSKDKEIARELLRGTRK